MKKITLMSLAIALSLSVFGQQKEMVKFETQIYDFGTVKEGDGSGGRVKAVFKFTNTSMAPIFIESASASCGCTTPKPDVSKPIAPGESGEIPVEYNTIGRIGTFAKNVTVIFKDADNEKANFRLIIKGQVVAKDAKIEQPTKEQAVVQPQKVEQVKAVSSKKR